MTQPRGPLLDVRERLTPADHQTHRRYAFEVPTSTRRLNIHVAYAPEAVGRAQSRQLIERATEQQSEGLRAAVGEQLARQWRAECDQTQAPVRINNLLTISLDDARGGYRGACHRHAPDQDLFVGHHQASPGLTPGPLPDGEWTLTLSVHTLASAYCEVSIQIGADTASSPP